MGCVFTKLFSYCKSKLVRSNVIIERLEKIESDQHFQNTNFKETIKSYTSIIQKMQKEIEVQHEQIQFLFAVATRK